MKSEQSTQSRFYKLLTASSFFCKVFCLREKVEELHVRGICESSHDYAGDLIATVIFRKQVLIDQSINRTSVIRIFPFV